MDDFRANDLRNLIENLKVAMDETEIRYYKTALKGLLYELQDDLKEEEENLQKESDFKKEQVEREREYREMQGF